MKMNKHILVGGMFLLVGLFAGCATTSISSNYDRSVDFSKLKTYAWGSNQELSGDPQFDEPLLRQTIQNSIDSELQAKGFQEVDLGKSDFVLKYCITTEQKKVFIDNNSTPTFNARGVWTGATGPTTYAGLDSNFIRFEKGTLVLDMLDPVSGAVLWQGTLSGLVNSRATLEGRVQRAPSAIADVLKRFPPVPGKK